MIAMEDAIDALYTALNSGLDAALTAIETARGGTVTRQKTLARYDDMTPQFPRIEIVPGEMTIDYGDPDQPLVEGIGYPSVSVFVTVAGRDPEALGDELSRYAEGIGDVIDSDNTLGGTVDWAYVTAVEWGPFLEALEDKRLKKDLRVEVQMKKHG